MLVGEISTCSAESNKKSSKDCSVNKPKESVTLMFISTGDESVELGIP